MVYFLSFLTSFFVINAQADFVDDLTREIGQYKGEIQNRPDIDIENPHREEFDGERQLFTAKDATEAIMTYSFQVYYQANSAAKKHARTAIEKQIKHMFGPLSHSGSLKAVPKEDHEITAIQVSRVEGNWHMANYNYKGTLLIEKSQQNTVELPLPYIPEQIYEAGIINRDGNNEYPCTDPHYQSEGDFWYFWDPTQYRCPLKEGEHYQNVVAQLERLPNTRKSYPEYNRLVRKEGDIEAVILFGMDKPHKYSHRPSDSEDINAYNYMSVRNYLLRSGFSQIEKFSTEQAREIFGVETVPAKTEQAVDSIVTIERFEKITEKAPIRITLYFGPSGISEENNVLFHAYLAWALESASVMLYNGHSGLGGHLNLSYIDNIFAEKHIANGKIALSKKQYQIYYFNSCSSYPYYNEMYFSRKKSRSDAKGTKQLDIITNGLATYFSVIDDTSKDLVRMIVQWADGVHTTSYQEFVKHADSNNLLGVNGDEDNPSQESAVH